MTQKDRRVRDEAVVVERRGDGRDRRLHQRVFVDLEVDYRCEDTFLFAYITDLSAMGIFVRTNNPEPPGTRLNLRFTIEDGPLSVEGLVIWVNPFRPGDFNNLNPGMGVKFIDVDDVQRRRIMTLVRQIAYLEGEEPTTEEVDAQAEALEAANKG